MSPDAINQKHGQTTCEYCRGSLGCDSAGLCKGCGAPMPKPRRVVILENKGLSTYGAVMERISLDAYTENYPPPLTDGRFRS